MATSVNGKTITKPFTASQGGYFTFTPTADTPYDADMFDFDTRPMPKEAITFAFGSNWVTEDTSEEEGPLSISPEGEGSNPNQNENQNEKVIYNLSGQRLQKLQKGINIVNGKKVIF